jgi:hypothetical protein
LTSLCRQASSSSFWTTTIMQLPTSQSQQVLTSQRRAPNCPHVLHRNHKSSRRDLVIAAGEARSANRTKWTQKDVQTQQQVASNTQKVFEIKSLPEVNDIQSAHDLVGARSPAAAAAAGQQQSLHDVSQSASRQARSAQNNTMM